MASTINILFGMLSIWLYMLSFTILAVDLCGYPFSLHAVVSRDWTPSAHASTKASLEASFVFHTMCLFVMQEAHTTFPAMALLEDVEKSECMSLYGQPAREVDYRLLSATPFSPSISWGTPVCAIERFQESNCHTKSNFIHRTETLSLVSSIRSARCNKLATSCTRDVIASIHVQMGCIFGNVRCSAPSTICHRK